MKRATDHAWWPCAALLPLALAMTGLAMGQDLHPRLQLSHALASVPASPGAALPAPKGHWTSQAGQWQPGSSACAQNAPPPWDRLSLGDALAHHLCKSPTLHQALAEVAEQTASVQLADLADAPQWNASLAYEASRNFNSTGNSGRTLGGALGLTWVLFDFGQRSATLQSARQTLAAAMASQSNSLLGSVKELLRLYGEAVVAHAGLEATGEAESAASRTAAAAQARYQAQVGSQMDRLQAQTALAQATLERVRAQSAWENARGQLALALGADIGQPLKLAEWEPWTRPTTDLPNLETLRREVRGQHPRLRAVQARIDSLKARLEAVKAENSGSVTVSASGGSSRNWGAAGSGNIPTANATLQASIPFFNGRESRLQQTQVLAQMNAQEAELDALQRETDSELWRAHQALITSQQSLKASEQLLLSADSTHRVAEGRYRAGVGSMLELLTAQATLADARRQRVTAQVEQLTAQTQLGLASGRVGR
jgi:outer membrane protein